MDEHELELKIVKETIQSIPIGDLWQYLQTKHIADTLPLVCRRLQKEIDYIKDFQEKHKSQH